MRRIWLLTLLAAGCAESSAKIEGEAQRQRQVASASASIGQYGRAAKEEEQANELHKKAIERALKEGRAQDLSFTAP